MIYWIENGSCCWRGIETCLLQGVPKVHPLGHAANDPAASNGSLHHLQRIERMTPVDDPPQMMMVRWTKKKWEPKPAKSALYIDEKTWNTKWKFGARHTNPGINKLDNCELLIISGNWHAAQQQSGYLGMSQNCLDANHRMFHLPGFWADHMTFVFKLSQTLFPWEDSWNNGYPGLSSFAASAFILPNRKTPCSPASFTPWLMKLPTLEWILEGSEIE